MAYSAAETQLHRLYRLHGYNTVRSVMESAVCCSGVQQFAIVKSKNPKANNRTSKTLYTLYSLSSLCIAPFSSNRPAAVVTTF